MVFTGKEKNTIEKYKLEIILYTEALFMKGNLMNSVTTVPQCQFKLVCVKSAT